MAGEMEEKKGGRGVFYLYLSLKLDGKFAFSDSVCHG